MAQPQSRRLFLVGKSTCREETLLAFSHRRNPPEDDPLKAPKPGQALLIGLAQLLAVLPGISRSGSTIAMGLALGMGRARAARFSFLLSIPAITGASLKEIYDLSQQSGDVSVNLSAYGAGFLCSFIVGLLSLKLLLRVIERLGMLPFVPYLVVVGLLALFL